MEEVHEFRAGHKWLFPEDGCERGTSTAGVLSAALLMVTPDDGLKGLALREILSCHRRSACLVL